MESSTSIPPPPATAASSSSLRRPTRASAAPRSGGSVRACADRTTSSHRSSRSRSTADPYDLASTAARIAEHVPATFPTNFSPIAGCVPRLRRAREDARTSPRRGRVRGIEYLDELHDDVGIVHALDELARAAQEARPGVIHEQVQIHAMASRERRGGGEPSRGERRPSPRGARASADAPSPDYLAASAARRSRIPAGRRRCGSPPRPGAFESPRLSPNPRDASRRAWRRAAGPCTRPRARRSWSFLRLAFHPPRMPARCDLSRPVPPRPPFPRPARSSRPGPRGPRPQPPEARRRA